MQNMLNLGIPLRPPHVILRDLTRRGHTIDEIESVLRSVGALSPAMVRFLAEQRIALDAAATLALMRRQPGRPKRTTRRPAR